MAKGRKPRATDKEHTIDLMIGRRICAARGLRGMSQSALSNALDVPLSFQQIQKNERGQNRVSVSRLVSIARAVSLPLQFFLDDLDLPQDADPDATRRTVALAARIERLPAKMREMVAASVGQFEALSADKETAS